MGRSLPRRTRRYLAVAVVLLVAAGAATTVALVRPLGPGPAGRRPAWPAASARLPGTAPWSLVASISAPVPGFDSLVSHSPQLTVPAAWSGLPSSLPVLVDRRRWVQVGLPPGAGDPAAWVPVSSVTLRRTAYRLLVDLGHARVLLLRESRVVMCAPADVGAPSTPTPTGRFYVLALAAPPSPAYGPFVVLTSATTGAVTDWTQWGTPLVTLSGPLGGAIPAAGAHQSTGGVRLPVTDEARLRVLPAGTPVDIVAAVRAHEPPAVRRLCPPGPW